MHASKKLNENTAGCSVDYLVVLHHIGVTLDDKNDIQQDIKLIIFKGEVASAKYPE
jgi:hypothetical protein